MDTDDLIERMKQAGEQVTQNYSFKRERSMMFPLAPLPKWIDKFPEENLTKKEKVVVKQQLEYESEVKVYRALEELKENLTVIHGFQYTHEQYGLFVPDHTCKCNSDNESEGECDFLLVHDKFVAVLEIKAPDFSEGNQGTVFERNYKDAKKQRERTCLLINGICRKLRCEGVTILPFTVFSTIERCSAEEISKYAALSDVEKENILFQDDLEDLEKLARRFQPRNLEDVNDIHPQLKHLLLGLWCIDNKNNCKPENFSLRKTIEDVDNRLRRSTISNRPQAPLSSLVKGGPPIFKQYLDIDCLTEEQKVIFNDEQSKLWINGPAGSGKTTLILGKVIQLMKSSEEKRGVIIFVPELPAVLECEKFLNKAGIDPLILNNRLPSEELKSGARVFIVYFKDRSVYGEGYSIFDQLRKTEPLKEALTSDCHIFIDEFHTYTSSMSITEIENTTNMIAEEFNSASPRVFWITYDLWQSGCYITETLRTELVQKCIVEGTQTIILRKLSKNLRNTYDIAELLASIRKLIIDSAKKCFEIDTVKNIPPDELEDVEMWEEFNEYWSKFHKYWSIEQQIGHYIHGPKPRFHFVEAPWSSKSVIINHVKGLVKKELLQLRNTYRTNTAIIVNHDGVNEATLFNPTGPDKWIIWEDVCNAVIEDLIKSIRFNFPPSVYHFDQAFSTEWTAVIGILELTDAMYLRTPCNSDPFKNILARLALMASRARTYCCIIFVVRSETFVPYHFWDKKSMLNNDNVSQERKVLPQEEYNLTRKESVRNDIVNLLNVLRKHMQLEHHYLDDKDTPNVAQYHEVKSSEYYRRHGSFKAGFLFGDMMVRRRYKDNSSQDQQSSGDTQETQLRSDTQETQLRSDTQETQLRSDTQATHLCGDTQATQLRSETQDHHLAVASRSSVPTSSWSGERSLDQTPGTSQDRTAFSGVYPGEPQLDVSLCRRSPPLEGSVGVASKNKKKQDTTQLRSETQETQLSGETQNIQSRS